MKVAFVALGILLAGTLAGKARASEVDEEEEESFQPEQPSRHAEHEDLARKIQNPFADLITVPFQNVSGLGYGPENGAQNVLNIQPVLPIALGNGWNLLMRPILPVSYTSWPESELGFGDLNVEPFFSRASSSKLLWGVGPILGVPTATDDLLGFGKWTAGPSVAVFGMRGHWALSVIANQQWSYAGDSASDSVSLFQLQPTVNYLLKHGWFLIFGPIISANWNAESGQKWIVPLGGGVGKVLSLGGQKMNVSLEGYGNVIHPDNGPDAYLLFTVALLFPR